MCLTDIGQCPVTPPGIITTFNPKHFVAPCRNTTDYDVGVFILDGATTIANKSLLVITGRYQQTQLAAAMRAERGLGKIA